MSREGRVLSAAAMGEAASRQDAPPQRPRPDAAPRAASRVVTSAELLGQARELFIRHAGELYVLRQTSKGKLILTK